MTDRDPRALAVNTSQFSRRTRLPVIAPTPPGAQPALRLTLDGLTETLEVLRGARGLPLDRSVLWRDLVALGLAAGPDTPAPAPRPQLAQAEWLALVERAPGEAGPVVPVPIEATPGAPFVTTGIGFAVSRPVLAAISASIVDETQPAFAPEVWPALRLVPGSSPLGPPGPGAPPAPQAWHPAGTSVSFLLPTGLQVVVEAANPAAAGPRRRLRVHVIATALWWP